MFRVAEDGQFVRSPGNDFQIRVMVFAFNQSDIQLIIQNLFGDVLGVFDVQRDRRVRVFRHILGHHLYRQIVADRQRRADVQWARHCVSLETLFEIFRHCHQCFGLRT